MFSHHLRVLIFSLFTLFVFGQMHAGLLSSDDARKIAADFFSDGNSRSLSNPETLKLIHTAKNSAAVPAYYVFGGADGKGFIIIAADTNADPVIGYSYEDSYKADNTPAAASALAGVAVRVQKSPSKAVRKSISRAEAMKKEPNTAKWSQEAPFNNKIPDRRLTGCVGTAMSTIMKYHNYPPQGQGSLNGVDFAVSYDWTNMRNDNYRNGYTEAEADAVATLVAHACQAIQTDFGMSSSSAFEVRVPGALINYFGYDPGVSYKKHSEMDKAAWDALLIDEIDAGRPVLYCGQDLISGHAFVCDGYEIRAQTTYFHINWGWGGLANGFYTSDALNPQASRQYDFSDMATIVYNIKPSSTDGAGWSPVHLTSDEHQIGMTMDVTDLTPGLKFTVRAGALKNISNENFSGSVSVALFSAKGEFKALLHDGKGLTLQSLQVLNSRYVDFNCAVPAGTKVADGDIVYIATKATGSDKWLPVAGDLLVIGRAPAKGNKIPYFNISMPKAIDGADIVCAEARVIKGRDFSFKVTPSAVDKVVTVKANGFILTPDRDFNYSIANINSEQEISIIVQNAADVVSKRNLWVTAGKLQELISDTDAGTIKDLTLFGSIDVNDFNFIRERMKLTRLDISGVNIVANGANPANAVPSKAFKGYGSLQSIILPANLTTLKNACFNGCGLRTIEIPASVATYEYNIFLNCGSLSEVIVRRESPAWINWCVFVGSPRTKLVVPTGASAAYSAKENWQDFRNIVEEDPVAPSEFNVAIQEMLGVKFTPLTEGSTVKPGSTYSFTVETDDSYGDATMEVYANNARLYADASGKYTLTVKGNTLLHANFKMPAKSEFDSPWKITDEKGGVGLATDVVNVVPGKAFTIRANALLSSKDDATIFYAAVLTDGKGGVKEIISPIAANNYNIYGALPCNFTCQVKEASVREGNLIRIATSYNKKTWQIVRAKTPNVSDSIKAIGNEVIYHTVTMPESVQGASIAGAVDQVVHGMPFSIKVTPVSVDDVVTVAVNGELMATDAAIANVSVPAVKEDLDVTIQVNPKGEGAYTVVNVKEGELASKIKACPARLKIVGAMLSSDFEALRANAAKIKALDLADVTIKGNGNLADAIPSNAFASPGVAVISALTSIILPQNLKTIEANAFYRCMNMSEITIPESVSYIGNSAFSSCVKLSKITVRAQNPPRLGTVPFPSNTANITLEVPKGSETAYRNAFYWNDLKITTSTIYYNIQIDPSRTFNYNTFYTLTKIPHPESAKHQVTLGLPNFKPTSYKDNSAYRPNIAFKLYDNGKDITYESKYLYAGQHSVVFDPSVMDHEYLTTPQNHKIDVVFHYGITFNHPANASAEFVNVNEADVWKDVQMNLFAADSKERPTLYKEANNYCFKVSLKAPDMEPKVKATSKVITTPGKNPVYSTSESILAPDENGIYTIVNLQGDTRIDITMVPRDGAILESSEIVSADAEEASDITTIGLTGEVTAEAFEALREKFTAVESVDLSGMSNEVIPDNAFEGMENLNTIIVSESVTTIGQKSFSGCKNLESVTFNSVETIGANAFEGCENLTSVTINTRTASASPAMRRASRAETDAPISDASFAGANPNCLIFVSDASLAASLSKVNVVYTGDSGNSDRKALTDIVIKEGHIFNTPGSFNLGDKTISFTTTIGHKERDNDGDWTGIVLPFSPTSISVEGVDYTVAENGKNTMALYAFSNEEAEYMSCQKEFKPNRPYLARINDSGAAPSSVVFSAVAKTITSENEGELTAEAFDVQTTPEEGAIISEGRSFTLHGNFENRTSLAGDYLLDESRANFVRLPEDSEATTLLPFAVYLRANSEDAPESFAISRGESSGISDAGTFIADGLSLSREGSVMVIMADTDRRVDVYDLTGRLVKTLSLTAGRNTVELPAGFYIVNGVKVIM